MHAIQSLLKSHRLRDTQPRRMVVQALAEAKNPLSPVEIERWIKRKGTINVVTIYRMLETFAEVGLVHRHAQSGRFVLCSMPQKSGHHGFLHCNSCDRIEEFHDAALCRLENRIARSAGFKATNHISEISGICKRCS